MFSLSIVIPNFNGRAHLERLLPSLAEHAPAGTQLIVVDDCSTDDSVAWTRAHFPEVEMVVQEKNGGFCASVIAGMRKARGEIVELLNNDTVVMPGWAEAGLAPFTDPTVGSVAPLVLRMDNPAVIDSAGQQYHRCGWAYNRGYGRQVSAPYLSSCEVFGPSGSCGFYRRSALARTGGLLPEYQAYFEDTDLAFRLLSAGFRCIFEPRSRVLHRGHASYGDSPRVTSLLARNEELAFWINLPTRELLLGLVPHLAFVLIRLVRQALKGSLRPFLAGKLQALQALNLIQMRRREIRSLVADEMAPMNLHLQSSWDVVLQGMRWMRYRYCN